MRSKRNFVIAGVVVGLGLAGLGMIGTPAHAGHTACTDDSPTQEIGTQISPAGSPVYLASVVYPGGGGTYYGAAVCYGLPLGLASGNVVVQAYPARDSTGDYTVYGNPRCEPEPGMVTVGCSVPYSTDTTDDGSGSTFGKTTDATVGVTTLNDSGAYVAVPSTTTTTAGAAPGTLAGTGSGTCVWVNGTTPAPGTLCPTSATIGGVNIATGDPRVSTRTVPGGCVGAAGNPCVTTAPSGAAVTAGGGDTTNKTVDGDVLLVGPVEYDLAKTCVVNLFTDCTTP